MRRTIIGGNCLSLLQEKNVAKSLWTKVLSFVNGVKLCCDRWTRISNQDLHLVYWMKWSEIVVWLVDIQQTFTVCPSTASNEMESSCVVIGGRQTDVYHWSSNCIEWRAVCSSDLQLICKLNQYLIDAALCLRSFWIMLFRIASWSSHHNPDRCVAD